MLSVSLVCVTKSLIVPFIVRYILLAIDIGWLLHFHVVCHFSSDSLLVFFCS